MAQHYKIEDWRNEPWYDSALMQVANEVVYSKELVELPSDYAMDKDTEHVYMIESIADGILDKENPHIKMSEVGFEVHVAKGKRIQQIYVPL